METQFINLNMTPSGVNPIFHISQYDVGRMLGFIVHSGGATVDLDTYTCTVEATRSDGTAITSAVATTDNIGTFQVTPTMSNKADKYRCQLVIVDSNSKRIASLPFDMDVCKAAMDENSESIEEDASLYQQYTEAVQGAIAEANADIQAEENARIAAVNAEATARANADATLQNNIDAEATARQSADNTLHGNINSEAATRASADSNLQSQINQIVAPSGEAPSAAEVQNARIGANGETYDTLGTAIRSQISEINSDLVNYVICKNLVGVKANELYPCYIPNGSYVTFSSSDGSPVYCLVNFYNKDKKYIDYWSLDNKDTRTIEYNVEDAYYVSVDRVTRVPIQVEIGSKKSEFVQYFGNPKYNSERLDALETIVENIEDKIPSFYVNYLDNRISTIKEKDLLIGNNGDSFIFITDLHNENNYYSPKLAREICKKTSVDRIIYGGDYINEPSSKNDAINYLTNRRNKCLVLNDAVFLRGNHDTNTYGTGQLTISEFYSIFDKHIEKHINTNKNTYFYNDNESQKIRYIFVDSGVDGSISDAQKNWIKINAEILNSDWTVIVFMHHGIYTDDKDDRTNIKVYPSLTSVKEALANVSCKIACIICGHTHIDLSDTSGKYPIICTTCDAHGIQASSMSSDNRDVNTINEQAFDVFHIDTANEKIYVTRIGGGENNVIESGNYSLNDREFSYS